MRNFLFIFLGFALFGGSFFALPASAHMVIQMDESGFHPAQIEIEQGEIVVFQNTGKEPHWPASNIHPSHQIYPEFDPKGGVNPGDSWEFKFDNAGIWKMHDHLFANLTGEIIVREKEGTATRTASTTSVRQKISSFFQSLRIEVAKLYFSFFPGAEKKALSRLDMLRLSKNEAELTYWIRILGAEKAMAKILTDSGNGSTRDCHQEAHQLGRISYQLFGAEVFKEGSASCHSGFYHGAMEALLHEKGTVNLASTITSVCNLFDTRFGNFECLHGIGHGVMAYEDYDLLQALRDCAGLPDQFAQSSCYGGVFMENVVTAQGTGATPGHTTAWANQDPHFPCNILSEDHEMNYQCYQMQTSWMLTLVNNDFKKVAAECTRAPKDMVSVCFQSFGRDAAGNTLRNPQKIKTLCDLAPQGDLYGRCVTGALNVIVDFWGSGLTREASDLCAIIPDQGKKNCYSTLAGRLMDIFKSDEERKKGCGYFEPAYQSLCHAK